MDEEMMRNVLRDMIFECRKHLRFCLSMQDTNGADFHRKVMWGACVYATELGLITETAAQQVWDENTQLIERSGHEEETSQRTDLCRGTGCQNI